MEPSLPKTICFDEIYKNPCNSPIDLLSNKGVLIKDNCYCKSYDKYDDLKPSPCCSFYHENEWHLVWIKFIQIEDENLFFWPLELYNLTTRKIEFEIDSENDQEITAVEMFPKDDISLNKKFLLSWGYNILSIYGLPENKQMKKKLIIKTDRAINALAAFEDKYGEIGQECGIFVLMTFDIGESFSLFRIEQNNSGDLMHYLVRNIGGFPGTRSFIISYFHDEISKKTVILSNFFSSYDKCYIKMLDIKTNTWGENSFAVANAENVSAIEFLFKKNVLGATDKFAVYSIKNGQIKAVNVDTNESFIKILPDTYLTQELCLWNDIATEEINYVLVATNKNNYHQILNFNGFDIMKGRKLETKEKSTVKFIKIVQKDQNGKNIGKLIVCSSLGQNQGQIEFYE